MSISDSNKTTYINPNNLTKLGQLAAAARSPMPSGQQVTKLSSLLPKFGAYSFTSNAIDPNTSFISSVGKTAEAAVASAGGSKVINGKSEDTSAASNTRSETATVVENSKTVDETVDPATPKGSKLIALNGKEAPLTQQASAQAPKGFGNFGNLEIS